MLPPRYREGKVIILIRKWTKCHRSIRPKNVAQEFCKLMLKVTLDDVHCCDTVTAPNLGIQEACKQGSTHFVLILCLYFDFLIFRLFMLCILVVIIVVNSML